jgi:hypothetical protein
MPVFSRRERPFQGADDAPFEIEVTLFVIALEVVSHLNALHRRVHDLPPQFSVGLRLTTHLVYYGVQRLICVMDEHALPALRIPIAV